MDNLLFNYNFYRFRELEKYKNENIPYDMNLMVEDMDKKYQINYMKNFTEGFVLFVKIKSKMLMKQMKPKQMNLFEEYVMIGLNRMKKIIRNMN